MTVLVNGKPVNHEVKKVGGMFCLKIPSLDGANNGKGESGAATVDWTVEVQKKNGCWTPTMYNHCTEEVAKKMCKSYGEMYPKKKFRVVKNEVAS